MRARRRSRRPGKATGGAPSRRPVFIAPAWRRSADWGTLRPLCGRARGTWASRFRSGSISASPLPAWASLPPRIQEWDDTEGTSRCIRIRPSRASTSPGASVAKTLVNASALVDDRPEAFPIRLALMGQNLLGRDVSDGFPLDGGKRRHRLRPRSPFVARVGQGIRAYHGLRDVAGAPRTRRREREEPLDLSHTQEKSRPRQVPDDLADSGQRLRAARSRPERQRRRRTRSPRRRHYRRVGGPRERDGDDASLPAGDAVRAPLAAAVR